LFRLLWTTSLFQIKRWHNLSRANERTKEGETDMTVFSESEDQKLFEDLWKLNFSKVEKDGRIVSMYPALYRLYLKVATPERIKKIKEAKKVE